MAHKFKQFVKPPTDDNLYLVNGQLCRKVKIPLGNPSYIIGSPAGHPDLDLVVKNGNIHFNQQSITKIGDTIIIDNHLSPGILGKPRCKHGINCCNADLEHIRSIDHDDDLRNADTWIRKINCRGKCKGSMTTHKFHKGSWECYICHPAYNTF